MKAVTKVFLVLAAVAGVISGCATKSEFKDLKERMDALESNKIQSIEGQISSIDTSIGLLDQADEQLERYIKALEEQVLTLEIECGEEREALEAAIKALQAEDESLHRQMEELKAYADTKLNGAKDWASATFATLEEYNKTVDVIEGIQANLDTLRTSITKEYKQAIEDAIGKSAESMKSWVNEQLTGYYDIATMNTKLDSLKSALEKQISDQGGELQEQIGQNAEDIETLKSDLKNATEDITEAYKKAIEEAITKYDGTITETIKKEIDSVNETIDDLDERVSDLETAVGKLEKRMDEVERTLKNLASIIYIPKYSDGIERVEYKITGLEAANATFNDMTLRFDVYPAACADSIAKAYAKDNSILSARAVYTQTRAEAGNFVNLDINGVVADNVNKGVLSVTISPAALDFDFRLDKLEASVILKITTDYCNIQSDYIPFIPAGGMIFFNRYDTNHNGVLEDTELAAIDELDLSDRGFTTVNLKKFTGLKTLNICGNPDLKTLDLTDNPQLTKVICPSFDYIIDCTVSCAETTLFYTPDGKQINLEDYETVIDGVTWKQFNVGARIGDIKGSLLTFSQASSTENPVCPSGYGLPTLEQLSDLTSAQVYSGSKCTVYHGINGRWFSGSKIYSTGIPAVFLPFTASHTQFDQIAYYWTCTRYTSYGEQKAHVIQIRVKSYSGKDFPRGEGGAQPLSNTNSVRCVKM